MTAYDYIKLKNALIERVTGVVLVPVDQLVHHNVDIRGFVPSQNLNNSNCTYCNIYTNCAGCPMHKAGNDCRLLSGTYMRSNELWIERATQSECMELLDLGYKFRKDYKDDIL